MKTTEKRARDAEQLPTPSGSAHAIAPDAQEHPPESPRAGSISPAAQDDRMSSGFEVVPGSASHCVADASASEPFSFGPLPSGNVGQLTQFFETGMSSETKSPPRIDRAQLDISAASSSLPTLPPLAVTPRGNQQHCVRAEHPEAHCQAVVAACQQSDPSLSATVPVAAMSNIERACVRVHARLCCSLPATSFAQSSPELCRTSRGADG